MTRDMPDTSTVRHLRKGQAAISARVETVPMAAAVRRRHHGRRASLWPRRAPRRDAAPPRGGRAGQGRGRAAMGQGGRRAPRRAARPVCVGAFGGMGAALPHTGGWRILRAW